MRHLRCRWFGHCWDQRSDACMRCRRTRLEIERGARPVPTSEEVSEAYWRGVHDGRKLDRRRAYNAGYRRGLREAQALADAIFGDRWSA